MELAFTNQTFKAVQKAGAKSEVFKQEAWRDIDIDSKHVLHQDYAIIRKVIGDPKAARIEDKRILRKLAALEAFHKSDPGKAAIRKLELLPEAIKKVVARTKHKWIFLEGDGGPLPYFVTNSAFHPAEQHQNSYTPARVTLTCVAVSRGEEKSRSLWFERGDLIGSVLEILSAKDVTLETDELVADYEKDLSIYSKWREKTGEQFLARGEGEVLDGRWREGSVSLERDDTPSKVVMDDEIDWGKDSGMAETNFWFNEAKIDEEDAEDESFPKPVHPFLRAFNLGTHEFIETHVSNLKPYVYDDKVSQKLVLPSDTRGLIDILMAGSKKKMEDIVKGKATGIIILCSGKPGTGKTLTAEVYSEAARRPLYTVQCSQLGTDEEALEKKLAVVLQRATRWKAILLIDEADVYIHERGNNIQQNAIVGVFLRLLEYYSGILFLTTNRVTVVDDAILSRTTAHVKYEILKSSEYTRLWKVLLTQYVGDGCLFEDEFLARCIKEFPKISGRSIRQLIRLALLLGDGKGVTIENLKRASAFHDFTELES